MRIVSVSDGGRKMAYEYESESQPNNKKPWKVRESDPMAVLGVDLMLKVYKSLDARSLASSLFVSRSWFSLASLDSLWSPLCTQLWVGKAHLPRWSKLPGLSKLTSYSRAVIDSKRVHIAREDLWDHAWIFHFTEFCAACFLASFFYSSRIALVYKPASKCGRLCGIKQCSFFGCGNLSSIGILVSTRKLPMADFARKHLLGRCHPAAPAYWKNLDPYWRGAGPLMRRYFHPDGTVTSDSEDDVWGGHECSYTVVTSILLSNGKIKENYVRVNRWPRLIVSRRDDWGWNMSNGIFAYSSIPDAGPSF